MGPKVDEVVRLAEQARSQRVRGPQRLRHERVVDQVVARRRVIGIGHRGRGLRGGAGARLELEPDRVRAVGHVAVARDEGGVGRDDAGGRRRVSLEHAADIARRLHEATDREIEHREDVVARGHVLRRAVRILTEDVAEPQAGLG